MYVCMYVRVNKLIASFISIFLDVQYVLLICVHTFCFALHTNYHSSHDIRTNGVRNRKYFWLTPFQWIRLFSLSFLAVGIFCLLLSLGKLFVFYVSSVTWCNMFLYNRRLSNYFMLGCFYQKKITNQYRLYIFL